MKRRRSAPVRLTARNNRHCSIDNHRRAVGAPKTEPPLVVPAKPCAIAPAPLGGYCLTAKVIGYAKVAFAVSNSRAGDVLGLVARSTPSVRTHFCSPTANCLSSSSKTGSLILPRLDMKGRMRGRRVEDLEFLLRFEPPKCSLGTRYAHDHVYCRLSSAG